MRTGSENLPDAWAGQYLLHRLATALARSGGLLTGHRCGPLDSALRFGFDLFLQGLPFLESRCSVFMIVIFCWLEGILRDWVQR